MRIYGGRGYSDHSVDLFMTVDQEDVAYLHIDYLFQKTRIEHIRIPADDVIATLWPRVLECVDEALDEALYEVLTDD